MHAFQEAWDFSCEFSQGTDERGREKNENPRNIRNRDTSIVFLKVFI